MFMLSAARTIGQKKHSLSRGLKLISTRLDAPLPPRNEKKVAESSVESTKLERIAKRIAASGVCSRRQAEVFIQDGKVVVNGEVISCPSTKVTAKDAVQVNSHLLSTTFQTKIWMANKLQGELVTRTDPQGRRTMLERLAMMGLPSHMIPVGRLDFNTEGLLLFTNNGDLARQLEHPDNSVARIYRVLVRGELLDWKFKLLSDGIKVDDIRYRPISATVESTKGKDTWLRVKVHEGKNREVRKALAHVKFVVKRLIRVGFGPYALGSVPKGAVLEVTERRLK